MINLNNIKCRKCGNVTSRYHCEGDGDCEGHPGNNKTLGLKFDWCISLHDEDNDWFICKTCNAYHVACKMCFAGGRIVLCRLVGHDGIFKISNDSHGNHAGSHTLQVEANNDRKMERRKTRLPKLLETKIEDIDIASVDREWLIKPQEKRFFQDNPDGDSCTCYYVGDRDVYYLDPNDIFPTGPDGGFCNEWKCPSCAFAFCCTDK